MKHMIFVFQLLIIPVILNAQVDRSTPPEAGPAPKIEIGDFTTFSLDNGLKVFVVENHKVPRVSFSLILDHDPVLEGDHAGYASITGQMLGTATTTKSKDEIDESIDFIGGTLSTSANSLYASSLKKHTRALLELTSDVLLNPVFKEEELNKLKKQALSGLAAEKEDPDAISSKISNVVVYGKDHPYGEMNSEESLESIKVDMCKEYYQTYFKPNIGYLAIVGDIVPGEAKKLAEKYYGGWQKAEVPVTDYPSPEPPEGNQIILVNRDNAVQSVIRVTYPVNLKIGDRGYLPAAVMNTVLGGGFYRLFTNLRETHGYTYGAYSRLKPDPLTGIFIAFADVRNAVTDSAVYEILYEMERLKTEKVPEEELTRVKNNMAGNFALSLERPRTIASFAINMEKYNLDKDYYKNYLKNLEAVTSENVHEVAREYMRPEGSYIVVVGKAGEIAENLKKLLPESELKYYDIYGNEYDPSLNDEVPDDVNAESIINSYLDAIGNEEKLSSIETIKYEMTMSMQGMQLTMKSYSQKPDKYMMEIMMGGNLFQKVVLNGDSGYTKGIQGKQELEGASLEELKYEPYPIPELIYDEKGFTTRVTGSEKIEGKECWKIEVTNPAGIVVIEYFDKDSGYKIRSVSTQESPQGEVVQTSTYRKYEEVEGLMLPSEIHQRVAGQEFTIQVENIEINIPLEDSIFE